MDAEIEDVLRTGAPPAVLPALTAVNETSSDAIARWQ